MHIAIDLDNTVLDATSAHVTYYNLASGLSLTPDDANEFYIYLKYGWSREERDAVYAKYGHEIHWNSVPYPTAVNCLRQLAARHEISIITARPEMFRDVTVEWLKHHSITYNNIAFVENKLEVCVASKVDVLIEDGPHYAEQFAQLRKPIILFDQPYNRMVTSEYVMRAANWSEVMAHIDRLAEKPG
ncbi:5' nucleotidase, NT5C type [Paenibacillus montanisoli]|uniref:5' nucleotidase, NT5C type n=1 Tax=Paenibacillus montanisoli TaxID=2081970 RepID=UPI00140330AF|nr:hypothetical protein [Paenibacillus montanisoli]